MKIQNKIIVLALIALGGVTATNAQTRYTIGKAESNSMELSGTSTLHDWKMKTTAFTGSAQFGFTENHLNGLKSLDFSLAVTNLKSDKKALDKNAYKALKTDKFPTINFSLSSAKIIERKETAYVLRATGKLTIAGVPKEVTIDINCSSNKNRSVTCTGKYIIKMTDYKVDPPSFMGGLMKTGDKVTLNFNMVFEQEIKQSLTLTK